MKKLLIFLDELYFKDEDTYISNYAAGSFFEGINGVEKTYLLPVSGDISARPEKFSTSINAQNNSVIELPGWNSVISYLKCYFRSGKTRKLLKQKIVSVVGTHDVIWIRQPSLLGLKLAKEGIKQNKKVIFHIAGDINNAWKNEKYKGLSRAFAFFLSKYMHARIKKLAGNPRVINLCTGSALFDVFSKLNLNTAFFIDSNIRKAELQSHQYDPSKKRFIYIGRLTEDKGIIELMNIFESIDLQGGKASLTIIGFGNEESTIKNIISDSKHESAYKFVGYVPNSEISGYLQQNDILILPSQLSEGFPRVIIEAWAFGLLVVSTNVGGIEGLGVHNENIVFSPLGDSQKLKKNIIDIIEDNIDIAKMQQIIVSERDKITYEYYRKIVEDYIHGL